MSKITTEDCKKLIKEHFSLSSEKTIKREKKYNDADGNIIREFKFNISDNCMIKEDTNGEIYIVSENDINKKDFKAKDFLRKYLKKFGDFDRDDPDEDMKKYLKEVVSLKEMDKKKLGNEFYYCFPKVYENDPMSLTNGLDTPMFRKGKYSGFACYGVFFHDSLESDPELYLDNAIELYIPKYFGKVDENIFEMSKNSINENMTIRDIMKFFDSLGFSYKNCEWFFGKEYDCMLHQLKLK